MEEVKRSDRLAPRMVRGRQQMPPVNKKKQENSQVKTWGSASTLGLSLDPHDASSSNRRGRLPQIPLDIVWDNGRAAKGWCQAKREGLPENQGFSNDLSGCWIGHSVHDYAILTL